MSYFMDEKRTHIWLPIVTGFGGALLGAGLVAFLTPKRGGELRELVRRLLSKRGAHAEPDEAQIDRMDNEGGVMQEGNARGKEAHLT